MKIKKLTKKQAIILTGFTGTLCCKFSDFQEDVEFRLGRPAYTHEFAFNSKEIKELYRDDFLKLLDKKLKNENKRNKGKNN